MKRQLKVYEATVQRGSSNSWHNSHYVQVPQIRMQGAWLRQLGFVPSVLLNIQCEEGKLIITKQQ